MGGISLLADLRLEKIIKKINNLIKDIDRNGYHYIGKPEPIIWEILLDIGVSELIKQIALFSKFLMIYWKYSNVAHIIGISKI